MSSASAAYEIGPIVFGPEQFQVQGRRVRYEDVTHLSWYWHSQTINFVNVQNANMGIHLRGESRVLEISKHTMWVSPKLAQAYQVLRERTWKVRLTPYLEQLESTGSIRYGGAEFFTNGMIRQGSDIFDLRNATEEPFSLTVKLGGFFSRKLSVALNLDHDVIHTLLGRFRENPEDPNQYVARMRNEREEAQAKHHWFFDVIRLCAKMAAADGRIDPDEILVVKEFVRAVFKLDESIMGRAVALFNEARDSAVPASFYAQRLMRHHGSDRKLIAGVLNVLRDIALSDDEFTSGEIDLLTQIARILGVTPNARSSAADERPEQPKTRDPEVNRHGRVLGLSGKVTIEQIRVAYRKLILEHHPDKHHRAPAHIQRAAHERMVEINTAYAFFRERYGL